MAVFRIEKTRDYTVMSNHHLRNAGLSLKSKGLLSMMLSLPEDWNYTTRGLAKICKEGTDSIASALKELERAGYIVRNRPRDGKSKIVDVEYGVYETPHFLNTGQPCEDEPDMACPDTENPNMDNPSDGSRQTRCPGVQIPLWCVKMFLVTLSFVHRAASRCRYGTAAIHLYNHRGRMQKLYKSRGQAVHQPAGIEQLCGPGGGRLGREAL